MKEDKYRVIKDNYCPLCGSVELKQLRYSTTCLNCGVDFIVNVYGFVTDKKILESYGKNIKMKIPNEKKEPYIYNRWKEMDLFIASNTERILMLELNSVISYNEFLRQEKLWNRIDMREFVRDVSQKIEKMLEDKK